MANNDPAGAASGISLDVLHKFFTVALAVATTVLGYTQFQMQHKLDVEQARLKQQVEKTTLVDNMLTRIEGYLEKQSTPNEEKSPGGRNRGLTATDKTRILISLLKIAADVHLQQTGQLETEEQKNLVRAIPLQFALLTDNDEMLVTIGSKPEDLPLWFPFARATADPEVKETAAIALERIAALTTDGEVHANIIDSLLELTVDWEVPELRNPVAKALGSVLARIDKEDLKDIPKLAKAFERAEAKFDLLKLAQETGPAPEEAPDNAKLKGVQPEIIEQVSQVFAEVQVLQENDPEIKDLILQLEDKDKNVRRLARSKLGSAGERAVPDLLTALETKGKVYRIRLGVVTAFLLMDQPAKIQNNKILLVTDLLGDPNSTVRKNTASFLIAYLQSLGKRKNTENEAIKSVVEALSKKLSGYDNVNGVYNSVVVLGEVRKQVPESFAKIIREKLIKTKEELAKNRPDWHKTISQIDIYLK